MIKIIKLIAARALLVSAGAVFYAQSAWALLPIEHWTEPNGARVWLVQSPAIPMVDVQVDFDAGARRDPAPQAGLAAAVALMSSKGVTAGGADEPALDENDLGEAWADLGASFGAQAGRDSFQYALRSLTEPDLLERAAQLAARQIAQPSFPPAVWASERARWSAAIKESYTRPGPVAAKAFGSAIYGDHPYGQKPSEETLARIEVPDLQAFHERNVAACRARVSIVGALDRVQAQALVQRLLVRLPARGAADCAPLPAVPEAMSKGVIDGYLLPWEVIPSVKLQELTKYDTETDPKERTLYTAVFLMAMNPAKYESLPPELKKVIDNNSGAALARQTGRTWDESATAGRKAAEDHKNVFYTVPSSELANWRNASASLYDEWVADVTAKGNDGKAMLSKAQSLIQKYEK